jgi:hypothetical protein
MRSKEIFDDTVEYHHLDVFVSLKRPYNFIQFRNGLRTEDVQGRMVQRHPPAGWRTLATVPKS